MKAHTLVTNTVFRAYSYDAAQLESPRIINQSVWDQQALRSDPHKLKNVLILVSPVDQD